MACGQDPVVEVARDRNLGHLEGDRAGVAYDAGALTRDAAAEA